MDMNMAIPSVDINSGAVFVSTVVAFVIGALWYSPLLFRKAWIRLSGIKPGDMQKSKKKGMGKLYLGAFIALLVMAYVLAHFVRYVAASSASDGMQLGFWLWLGFVAPVQFGVVLWQSKPFKLFLIDTCNYLVILEVMASILAVWG